MANYAQVGKLGDGTTISKVDLAELKLLAEFGVLPTLSQAYKMLEKVLICDVNGDGKVDRDDIEALATAIANGTSLPEKRIIIEDSGNTMVAGPFEPPASDYPEGFLLPALSPTPPVPPAVPEAPTEA